MPQSMQRAPCACSLSSGSLPSSSRQSFRRSSTGRRAGISRAISRNPVIFPIPPPCGARFARVLRWTSPLEANSGGSHYRNVSAWPSCTSSYRRELRGVRVEVGGGQDLAVLDRHHLDELLRVVLPSGEEFPGDRALRVLVMA